MTYKFLKYILRFLLIVLIMTACATGAKSPQEANTAEILFGDNVQQYLAARRAKLQGLHNRATDLDQQILLKLGQLHRLERDLEATRTTTSKSDQERIQLMQEVAVQKSKAEKAFNLSSVLKAQSESMQKEDKLARENRAPDQARIKSLDQDIADLEAKVVVLDRAIERNLKLKAEQYYRDNDAN